MQFDQLKRREFIALIGGAAAWPLSARAQQPERMRRVGVLMNLTADDPEASARVTAFAQGLQQLGWTAGHNVRIDYRWGAVDADRSRRYAAELVALAPDVILASGVPVVTALLQATRTVPIDRAARSRLSLLAMQGPAKGTTEQVDRAIDEFPCQSRR
jgi:putative tryptophan/tyrosine transport system substrate-binding protein